MTMQIQGHIGCMITRRALGKPGNQYQRLQETFLQKNGPEWTCRRSKAVWNIALLIRQGDIESARQLCRENSIAYHKQSGIPKGIEGYVVKQFSHAQRPSVLKRLSACMRFYTSLTIHTLSHSQKEKAVNGITNPYKGTIPEEELESLGLEMIQQVLLDRDRNQRFQHPEEITQRERDASHLKVMSSYYGEHIPSSLNAISGMSFTSSLLTKPWIPSSLEEGIPAETTRSNLVDWYRKKYGDSPQTVGSITVLQEQGCKARVVTKPSAWCQLAFMPLNGRLFKATEGLFPKESCCFDQTRGAYAMDMHMKEGHSTYSVDLSSATDRIPRRLSIGILRGLGYDQYADALEEFCNMPIDGSSLGMDTIHFAVGQPMGLYGSFPLLQLTNLTLCHMAVTRVKQQVDGLTSFHDDTYFKVVGDDVIFSDENVSSEYRSIIREIGVDVSEHKSFSGFVSEFAGFVSIKTNKATATYRPYKIPSGKTITNGIQFLDALGIKVKTLSNWWKKTYESYKHTVCKRDIALQPLVTFDDQPPSEFNRMDAQTLMSRINRLLQSVPDPSLFPDIKRHLRENKVPLFLERGPFQYYGTDLDQLERRPHDYYSYKNSISRDPLMTAQRQYEREQEDMSNPSMEDMYASLFASLDDSHDCQETIPGVQVKVHRTNGTTFIRKWPKKRS